MFVYVQHVHKYNTHGVCRYLYGESGSKCNILHNKKNKNKKKIKEMIVSVNHIVAIRQYRYIPEGI